MVVPQQPKNFAAFAASRWKFSRLVFVPWGGVGAAEEGLVFGFVARADAAVVPNGNGHRHNGNGHAAPAPADSELAGSELADAAGAAVRLRRVWGAGAVVVTVAERGAVLSDGERPPLLVPAPGPASGDSCGAGDRFASTALAALAGGAPVLEAVTTAVTAATAYVAAGGALTLRFQRDRPADRERSGQIT